MNAVAFDTLKTARALERKGFSREQSEGLAEQLAEGLTVDLSHLATKEELKHEIALVRADLTAVKIDLKADIKHEIAQVRADMRDLENRMTIKLGGMLVVITGVLLAAIRYLPQAG